ncbi:LysR family transcriptional regulator [Bacillus cytotoxicus]|uniref:HTH-type transcriptional regulator CzcR n=1 Tax=Bacillus cytotoxicus TaxID=580165 RepID=A0AAX2CBT4_9BACI|nr:MULTISPECIES: LysR family transcriptional regulator [Bacillus cereus group]AWC31314.1 LysR family transcriptional regulator [Bacillus cytotoxicus]AWC35355.1 LysR family transcriptional regulator [Bacillus cytotoxicus]AWC59582.1 LysR family transcriptional regulator [Bacillus cytotoxicus]KMT48645.1 LysR family transcriptional regulator [Bacillus cytotoxicus]QTR83657.1 LysR family transcriptional regulator [Bacillus cytotoxicus]
MNLQDFVAFYMVAQEKSISKAAVRLNFVQSNVTAKIKRLEVEYETQLFYRHRNGVTLTHAGEKLLIYAEKMIQLLNESKRDIKYTILPEGTLKIGAMETAAAVRLPNILSNYHTKYPEVEIALQTNSTEELTKKVLLHELEGAFVANCIDDPALEKIEVFQEEMMLLSKKSLLLDHKYMENQSFIVFQSGCFYRKVLEEWLLSEGIVPRKVMELNSLDGIIGCVKAGLGVSILPREVAEQFDSHQELVRKPLLNENRFIPTYFIYRKDSVKTATFNEFIRLLV